MTSHKGFTCLLLVIFAVLAGMFTLPFLVMDNIADKKFAYCNSSSITKKLTFPRGKLMRIVLGVPGADTNWSVPNPKIVPTPPYAGDIKISQNGQLVALYKFSSAQPESAGNWLTSYGFSRAFILTKHKVKGKKSSIPVLNDDMQAGQDYDITVTFSRQPPTGSQLWLCWVTNVLGDAF